MTAGVGFDKYWDDGGGEFAVHGRWGMNADGILAVTPDEAAKTLIEWAEKLDMSKSGEYWAPRGPRKFLFRCPDILAASNANKIDQKGDIGTADVTIGTNLPTPLQLPW